MGLEKLFGIGLGMGMEWNVSRETFWGGGVMGVDLTF